MHKKHSKTSHKANYKDEMGKQPLGTGKSGSTGKDANKKASDSFKRV